MKGIGLNEEVTLLKERIKKLEEKLMSEQSPIILQKLEEIEIKIDRSLTDFAEIIEAYVCKLKEFGDRLEQIEKYIKENRRN